MFFKMPSTGFPSPVSSLSTPAPPPLPPRRSVDSSLVRLGRAIFTLRPDAVCYESKFRLGL
jgi:hypothetical protein